MVARDGVRTCRFFAVWCTAVALFIGAVAHAQVVTSEVRVLNATAFSDSDNSEDDHLTMASDGAETLVVVWRARGAPAICKYEVVLMARSDDAGVSWTPPVSLGEADLPDYNPDVATDGQGTWFAVWAEGGSNRDIYYVRSLDNGVSWSAAERIVPGIEGRNEHVEVATDGLGNWIILWTSKWNGFDQDIVYSRSTDLGATWSAPQPILAEMVSDTTHEFHSDLAGDGNGTLVAAWTRYAGGKPMVIQVVQSEDGGATWSGPMDLEFSDEVSGYEAFPSIAGDGQGNWIIAWESATTLGGTIGSDCDVLHSVSNDNGLEWRASQLLNSNGTDDVAIDGGVDLDVDAWGNWIAVWHSEDDLGGTIGTDFDILVAVSADGGESWTDPQPSGYAATDSSNDGGQQIVPVGHAGWRLAWNTRNPLGGTVASDLDILTQALRIPFDPSCASDSDGDGYGDPGDPSCPLGGAEDCDDGDPWVWPGGSQVCDGVNNDCLHPSWPVPAENETDDDGDGFSECADYDCSDTDPNVWGAPGEVQDLLLGKGVEGTLLMWSPPLELGGTLEGIRYDVLRATRTSFCLAAYYGEDVCVDMDVQGEQATDSADPDSGEVFFYLVRAVNYGFIHGPLGFRSSGTPRRAPGCGL